MGVETGLIIAMAASAAASLGSAAVGAINNKKSLEAQRDMYERQRVDQISDYNNRTGIKAQLQQYQEAGINPAAVLGSVQGGSMPSVPSAPEIPKLENYGASFGQGITQTMEALAKIKGFQKQDAEVQNLLSQQRLTDLQSSYQEGQNFLQQNYGDSEHAIGLQKMYADTMLAYAEGRYRDSYVSLNNMIEKLKGEEFKHMQTENSQFGLILAKQLQLIGAQVDSERAKPALMRSEMASNYGVAEQAHALALESGTRTAGIAFENVVKKIDSDQAANTAIERLNALVAKYKADENVSKKQALEAEKEATKLRERIKHYKQYPNSAKFDEFWDNFPIIGGIVRALAK